MDTVTLKLLEIDVSCELFVFLLFLLLFFFRTSELDSFLALQPLPALLCLSRVIS